MRFRLNSSADDELRCRLHPSIKGLALSRSSSSSCSDDHEDVPSVPVSADRSALVSYSFTAAEPGQHISGEIDIEIIDADEERSWYKVPAGAFTLNVGDSQVRSIVINADVISGGTFTNRDVGGVVPGLSWLALPLLKAAPPLGHELPSGLWCAAAAVPDRTRLASLSWGGGKDQQDQPRTWFVFGGSSVEIGRKTALTVSCSTEKTGRLDETGRWVSRKHSVILVSRNRKLMALKDLGSKNGTFIETRAPDGTAAEGMRLQTGKQYRLNRRGRFRMAAQKGSTSVLFKYRAFYDTRVSERIAAVRLRRMGSEDREYVLVPHRAIIGSDKRVPIRVASSSVPASAAVLEWQESRFVLGPAEPGVELFVNGKPVPFGTGVPLQAGARVMLGQELLVIEEVGDERFEREEEG